jgi:hypothetical protein
LLSDEPANDTILGRRDVRAGLYAARLCNKIVMSSSLSFFHVSQQIAAGGNCIHCRIFGLASMVAKDQC